VVEVRGINRVRRRKGGTYVALPTPPPPPPLLLSPPYTVTYTAHPASAPAVSPSPDGGGGDGVTWLATTGIPPVNAPQSDVATNRHGGTAAPPLSSPPLAVVRATVGPVPTPPPLSTVAIACTVPLPVTIKR